MLEFSGQNNGGGGIVPDATSKVTKILFIVISSILLLLALAVHDTIPGLYIIFIECIVISIIGLIIELIKQIDRHEKINTMKLFKSFSLFLFIHFLLQFGGFYSHIFKLNISP